MPNIFISYRRDDEPYAAGHIYERLNLHFEEDDIFFDIDTVPFGVDFREYISGIIRKCDILLVIIGDNWLEKDSRGRTRLESPSDYVRIEIELGFSSGVHVIPLLVRNATIPGKAELPDSIADLVFQNAAEVRTGSTFQGHIERLIHGIENLTRLSVLDPRILKALLSDERMKILSTYQRIPPNSVNAYYQHLIEQLSASSSRLRMNSLRALYEIRPKERSIHLLRMLHDSSNAVRRVAVFLIGESGSREHRTILSSLMNDASPDVRAAARDADRKLA